MSFPLRADEGEIVLCPAIIKKEIKDRKFDKTFPALVKFLVIHGMLHLKGHEHSSTMSELEKKYGQKHFGGHRLGVLNDKDRSGRVY